MDSVWLGLFVACSEDPLPRPSLKGVTCAPQPDAHLRWDCALDRREPGPTVVSWSAAGRTTTALATGDALTLWGLAPDDEVTWIATDGRSTHEGAFHTDPLPVPIAVETVGDAVARDVLFPVTCGEDAWLAMARTDGVVEWLEPAGRTVSGFGFSPPDTVLATLDRRTLSRIRLDGDRVDEEPSALPLHHDVTADADGRTVLMVAEAHRWDDGQDVVLDGLLVLSDESPKRWSLADHTRGAVPGDDLLNGFWEDEFPGAGDWSHGNAATVAPDGDLLVSLRWWSAIYRLAGPGSSDFGAVRWVLAGRGAPFASDLELRSETGDDPAFKGQHHPLLHPDGTLTVFDNGPPGADSRVLRFRLDDGAATLIEVTPLGTRCGLLGSAYPVEDGGLLVTCADQRTAWEFAPGATEPRWRMRVSCDGTPFYLNRVQPVDLPGR